MRNPLELIVRPIYTIYVLKYLKEKEGGKMEGTVEKKIIVRRLNRWVWGEDREERERERDLKGSGGNKGTKMAKRIEH